jgi:hypothetical protein
MSARSFNLDKKRQGNITVEVKGNVIDVRLHGHLVAYQNAIGEVIVSSCGWHTVTTKTAINRFLNLLGSRWGIMQKKGDWFLTDNNQVIPFKDGMKVPSVSKLERALK